ncbi:hypothetical protein FOZ61_001659, partial [Perkinsus olseni]
VKQSPQLDEANAKSSGIRQAVREAVASVEVVPEVAVELPVADATREQADDGQASGVSKPARSESSKKRREQTAEELREVAEKKARIALFGRLARTAWHSYLNFVSCIFFAGHCIDCRRGEKLEIELLDVIIPANRVRQRRKVAEGFASAIERGVRAEEMREPVNDFARDAGERLEAEIFVKEDAATEGGWSKYLKEVSRIGKNLLDAGGITQILERQQVSLEQVASHHCTGEWLENMKINDEAVPYTDRWRSLHKRLTRELMRQCGESERGDGDEQDGKELAATSWALELCRRCWESSVARREDGGFDTDMRYYNNMRGVLDLLANLKGLVLRLFIHPKGVLLFRMPMPMMLESFGGTPKWKCADLAHFLEDFSLRDRGGDAVLAEDTDDGTPVLVRDDANEETSFHHQFGARWSMDFQIYNLAIFIVQDHSSDRTPEEGRVKAVDLSESSRPGNPVQLECRRCC